jgi:hypothetical protein
MKTDLNHLTQMIVAHMDNEKLSDSDFREFVRNISPSTEELELMREEQD